MAQLFVEDIRACLRFYSRLPVRIAEDGHAMPDFSRVSWATPVAGAIIGSVGALVLFLSRILHLPPLVAAACAVCALVLATGALHEDGLADIADGFGGGATREQKLSIMRDSRIGSYGALALVLSALLRISTVAAMFEQSVFLAALSTVAVAAVSRAVGLLPLVTLSPARSDGAGSSAARPSPSALRVAFYICLVVAFLPVLGGASLAQTVVAFMAAVAGAVGIARLAAQQIGGYTGDVLGAAQQVAEIAALVALSA